MKEAENNFDVFPTTSLSAWERIAKEELKGADPWKKLIRVVQGVEIKPIYAAAASGAASFQLEASKGTFLGPRTWYNCPLVIVHDPIQANAMALEHLRQGANGIFFELEEPVDLPTLLKSIEWPFCSLNFLAKNKGEAIAKSLELFLARTRTPTHGALFGTPQSLRATNGSFRFIGIAIPSDIPPIDALAKGIITLENLLGNSLKDRLPEVAFTLEIGTDFFMETSKLRALRVVWRKLLASQGANQDIPLFIHAWSRAWTDKTYEPHGNMLKATTASMAAILGGCDVLTVDAEDPNNSTMSRAARNVSNILREESHFSKVADPLAGSYLVDDLTRQLSENVWSLVQKKIRS